MAGKRTIGNLVALVTSNSAQLKSDFQSVDNTIRRSTTSWQRQLKGGLKLGFGIAGAQGALSMINAEIRHVIENVERIPGLSPEVVASVVEARGAFAQFRAELDRNIAGAIAFGAEFGQAIGAGVAMMLGSTEEDVAAALSKLSTPDEQAAAKDPQYWEKVEAARRKLVETQKKAAQASMTEAEQIRALREEAERYETFAQSSSINSEQRLDAETEAAERTIEANKKLASMKEELRKAEEKLSKSVFGAQVASIKPEEALEGLRNRASRLSYEMAQVRGAMEQDPKDPKLIELMTKKTEELAETNKQLEKSYDRIGKRFEQVGEDLASGLEAAVFSGGSLRDMLQGLEQDLLRIIFRTAITEPLGKWAGGAVKSVFGSIFGGFFAEGGRPPVNRASIVGENGPEFFVPDSAGTIIPASRMPAGGGSGSTFYIDARGADRTGLARLEGMIRALDGSIEPRAVAASFDARRRNLSSS